MVDNGKNIANKLKLLIRLATLCVFVGLAFQLDILLNKRGDLLNLWFLIPSLLLGFLIGWLLVGIYGKRLVQVPLRIVLPFWIGMAATALLVSGLLFITKVQLPMDWRPIIAAGLFGTLPGLLLGGLFSWYISRDIIAAGPSRINSLALATLTENLKMVKGEHPQSESDLRAVDNDTYLVRIQIPRFSEDIVFYILCDENYPSVPPVEVAVEAVLPDGTTQPMQYDAPIVHYWNNRYGLRHIVEEALQILMH